MDALGIVGAAERLLGQPLGINAEELAAEELAPVAVSARNADSL